MSNWFWGVCDNFLPGHSRSQNFLKKGEGFSDGSRKIVGFVLWRGTLINHHYILKIIPNLIGFLNSSRTSFRDPKIRNQHHRKTWNPFFRNSNFSWPNYQNLDFVLGNHNQLLVSNKQNNEVFVLGSLEVAQAVYTDCWPCVAQNYELCSVHALSCSVDALQNNETCSFGGAQLLSKCGFPANVTIAGAINGTAQFNLFCEKYVTHDTTPAPDDDTTPAPYIKIKLPATCETEANKYADTIERFSTSKLIVFLQK